MDETKEKPAQKTAQTNLLDAEIAVRYAKSLADPANDTECKDELIVMLLESALHRLKSAHH